LTVMAWNFVEEVVNEGKHRPFSLILLLSLLAVSIYGWNNYARADDVQTRIEDLEDEVKANGRKINTLLAVSLSESIRRHMDALCKTERGTSEYYFIERTISQLQNDHHNATGRFIGEKSCHGT
jgi:hypothetical protein